MCPAHNQDHIIVHPTNGSVTCGECSRIRARVALLKGQNGRLKRTQRHPRETLSRVANAPLLAQYDRLIADGVTASEIARRAGWIDKRKDGEERGDIGRLRRALGLSPYSTKHGGEQYMTVATEVNYETAVTLCRALEIEYPSEVGV